MSNPYLPNRNRNRVLAVGLVGALAACALVGGVYAGLAKTISTEADSESINSSLTYTYSWTVDSEPIDATVTPVSSPVPQNFVKGVVNDSSVAANYAFWVSGVDVADIPDSLLDYTTVKVTQSALPSNMKTDNMTLRQFLTSAIVVPTTVTGNSDFDFTVTITAPNNTSPVDFSDALGFTGATFNTNFTFSQVISGTSALKAYATTYAADHLGSTVPWTDTSGLVTVAYLIPIADVETAAGL